MRGQSFVLSILYFPLKANFLSLQKLLATIFSEKESVKWYLQPWFWRQISIVKIVCEWFQLWEEIRIKKFCVINTVAPP